MGSKTCIELCVIPYNIAMNYILKKRLEIKNMIQKIKKKKTKKKQLLKRKLNPETNKWTTGKKRKSENHSKNSTRQLTEIPKSKNRESKRETMIRKSTRKFPELKDTCCRLRELAERSAQ